MKPATVLQFSTIVQGLARGLTFVVLTVVLFLILVGTFQHSAGDASFPSYGGAPAYERSRPVVPPWREQPRVTRV